VIVLDTHALLWWALDPDRLSQAATASLREMEGRGGFASAGLPRYAWLDVGR